MRFAARHIEVCFVSLLCTVASLTFSNAEVKVHAEGHENPCHPGSLATPKSKSCLEEELKELRESVDQNRQLIDSLEKREEHVKDGQPEFPDADLHLVTESHPAEAVEEVDDLIDVRRYSTTTLRTVDVEEPVMEDSGDDDEDDDDETEEIEENGDHPVPQKRSGGDDDDDDDDDDEDDDDDDDDEEEDEDDYDEMRRKKKGGMNELETSTSSVTSTSLETSSDNTHFTTESSTPSTSGDVTEASVDKGAKRNALLSGFDKFLDRDKKSGARNREAEFEGVGKLKQIREIDKRVDQKLKEKYINAVEPRADEELLELMVKIAENPKDWNNVHAMLQQLDEDIAVVQQIENQAKNLENKRDENGVETKSKSRKLTKEERKQQQAEKKKKKKKKKQRQKEKLAREQKLREEEEDKSRLAVETLRRQQLERAGLLNAAGRTMMDQNRYVKPTMAKTAATTTTTTTTEATTTTSTTTATPSTTTVPPVATTWLPKELQGVSKLKPHGATNHMKTLDSAIDVLSKDHARIVLNPSQWPRPKSPMQEVREKWPKALSNLERPINTAKAIVTGRLRPSADDDDRPRTTSESNEWSKADIASAAAEDKERARARFFKETVFAKNNVVHWKPNAKAKWLETVPLPSKEHRASSHNTYFNGEPSRKQPDNGWPDFTLNALKHGADPANEEVVIAEQSVADVWPNLPVDDDRDWPDFSSNTIDADRANGWNRKQQAIPNTWPGISHSKALEHAKEVAGSKQWPHFAYHRVTSSPLQSRQRQQQEAQQRARHRNAYIAVSIISPPKNRSTVRNATAAAARQEASASEAVVNETRQLPDKIDELLDQRNEQTRKLTPVDPLEEQLIDMAAAGTDARSKFNWSHSRHLDKIQEQLKTLGAMEAKLQAQWLEKERLRQILRDGGKSGSYYRDARSESQQSAAASSFDKNQTSDA